MAVVVQVMKECVLDVPASHSKQGPGTIGGSQQASDKYLMI